MTGRANVPKGRLRYVSKAANKQPAYPRLEPKITAKFEAYSSAQHLFLTCGVIRDLSTLCDTPIYVYVAGSLSALIGRYPAMVVTLPYPLARHDYRPFPTTEFQGRVTPRRVSSETIIANILLWQKCGNDSHCSRTTRVYRECDWR